MKKFSLVLSSLGSILLLANCSQSAATKTPAYTGVTTYTEFRTVLADTTILLTHPIVLNPDCTVRGFSTLRIVQAPEHGEIEIGKRADYPNFPSGNPRSACGKKKARGSFADYTPDDGFVGQDFVIIESISPGGDDKLLKITISVK